jgi:BMFP domain-containing protein YqiC
VVLAPGEVVVSASRLAALEAKVAELEKAPEKGKNKNKNNKKKK